MISKIKKKTKNKFEKKKKIKSVLKLKNALFLAKVKTEQENFPF